MNREEVPVKPLKIIKVLKDKTLKEARSSEGEREIVILVSDANKKKFVIKYDMEISKEGNGRLETRVLVLAYTVKDIDIHSINAENWNQCVCDNWVVLSTYSDWETMYDELWKYDIEENEYHIDWQDFFKKSPLWNNLNLVDLHMHSGYSDGTDWVSWLVHNLKENGITIFSVTDHDTVEFYKNITEYDMSKLDGMRLIPGIEFSCKTEFGKCHILGYGIDVNNVLLTNAIMMTRALRNKKMITRLLVLEKQYGIVFDEEDKKYLAMQNSVGKPHIANILVKKGLAANISDAISKFLSNIPNDGDDRIDAQIAIDAIIAAGGIPVWAHPLGGIGEKRLSEERFTEQLHCLVSKGIQGLEMYYSLYSCADRKLIRSVLLKNNYANKLYISGGSDYHGRNKNVKPGELTADDEVIFGKWLSILSKIKIDYDNRFETCSIDETKFLCDNVVFALGKQVNMQVAELDGKNDFVKRYNFLCSLFEKSPLFKERHFEEAPENNKWYYSENGLIHLSLCEDKNNPLDLISKTEASALNKCFLDDLMSIFTESLGYAPNCEVKQVIGLQTITLY